MRSVSWWVAIGLVVWCGGEPARAEEKAAGEAPAPKKAAVDPAFDPNLFPTIVRYATTSDTSHLSWAEDGVRLVTNAAPEGQAEGVYLINTDSGEIKRIWEGASYHPLWLDDVAIAFVGRGAGRKKATLYQVELDVEPPAVNKFPNMRYDPLFEQYWQEGRLFTYNRPSGRELLFFVWGDGAATRGWYSYDLTTRRPKRIEGADDTVHGPPHEADPKTWIRANTYRVLLEDRCETQEGGARIDREDYQGWVVDLGRDKKESVSREPPALSRWAPKVKRYGGGSSSTSCKRSRQSSACLAPGGRRFAFFTRHDTPGRENLNVVQLGGAR